MKKIKVNDIKLSMDKPEEQFVTAKIFYQNVVTPVTIILATVIGDCRLYSRANAWQPS